MLKILTKHIECGKYSFKVAIDRDIAIKSLEAFPELSAYIFNTAKAESKKPKGAARDEVDILVDNIKTGKTSELAKREDEVLECVKFAFPLMLAKAGETLDAKELIAYMEENGVIEDFTTGMYELILMGFTQREVAKKKVGFSMK